MKRVFFIVGPTATGKSEIAAEVACRLGAEIVSADAFQIYRGLDLLTAKPDQSTLAKAPHHLIGAVPLREEMNAEKYRAAAETAIREIHARGKPAIVVGGSGLYVKALTHGLAKLPAANSELREELAKATIEELFERLRGLDPAAAGQIDRKNKRRLVRAIEVCLLTGKPFSAQRTEPPVFGVAAAASGGEIENVAKPNFLPPATAAATPGMFVYRERDDLYQRIDRRVEEIFEAGVVEEVRALGNVGPTAEKTLGLREIQMLLAGEISEPECIAKIQQTTRRYAKRQLTWFRRQSNFEPLNLSTQGFPEAIDLIAQSASRVFANG
jgi:tRNA dimethylallyltransferase